MRRDPNLFKTEEAKNRVRLEDQGVREKSSRLDEIKTGRVNRMQEQRAKQISKYYKKDGKSTRMPTESTRYASNVEYTARGK